jgi:hypothetical protein
VQTAAVPPAMPLIQTEIHNNAWEARACGQMPTLGMLHSPTEPPSMRATSRASRLTSHATNQWKDLQGP